MLIDLDDSRARDPGVVGAKAARLSQARQVGLPSLPGVVVPVEAATRAIASAAAALATGGSGAARLAVIDLELDPDVVRALEVRAADLGHPVVVRSSSPLETGGVWAGAFSSFDGVGRDDLRTAVRGVWASAFTVHALERCEAVGADPAALELAVLLQPQIDPVCAGSARVLPDGRVAVHATRGSARYLMEGWEVGVRATVHDDGTITGAEALQELGEDALLSAARLAREVMCELGDNLIEWAWTGRDSLLFQSSQLLEPAPMEIAEVVDLDDPLALHVARLALRFPGALGEELVMPWAVAMASVPPSGEPTASSDPLTDLALAAELATELTKHAWQTRAHLARGEVAAMFSALRGGAAADALARLARLRPPEPEHAARVISLIEGAAAGLVEEGRLERPEQVWRHSLAAMEQVAGVHEPTRAERHRPGPDRWEPFVHAAVRRHGTATHGIPVVSGASAGRIVVVRNPHDPPRLWQRPVLVVDRPLPALSSLLWSASALVATAGNPAAHLMEVAASLGVPTVLGVDLTAHGGLSGLAQGEFVAAVDGERGAVTIVSA